MSVMVKKFGGSSVANIDRIEFIADKIVNFYKQHKQLIIVVSAMQGETDKLENLAYKITPNPDPREMDALIATGEQVTISLLTIALIKRGCKARSYTGLQLGLYTDNVYNNAKIKHIDLNKINQDLENGVIAVVAGFQGMDQEANITTLGRGGSDTTAVALAAVLKAKECYIYTDVDGVYTADPNIEPNAKKLDSIDFSEMLELSGLGAKVMQIKAVAIGSYYNVPIRVLSSFNTHNNSQDNKGTLIKQQTNNLDYKHLIKIAVMREQTKIIIKNLEYYNNLIILNKLAELGLELDMLSNNHNDLSFVISNKYLSQFLNQGLKQGQDSLVKQHDIQFLPIAKLSLVGFGIGSKLKLINQIYNSLYINNIIIKQAVTTETKVSVLLNEKDLELAIKILHKTLVVAENIDISY